VETHLLQAHLLLQQLLLPEVEVAEDLVMQMVWLVGQAVEEREAYLAILLIHLELAGQEIRHQHHHRKVIQAAMEIIPLNLVAIQQAEVAAAQVEQETLQLLLVLQVEPEEVVVTVNKARPLLLLLVRQGQEVHHLQAIFQVVAAVAWMIGNQLLQRQAVMVVVEMGKAMPLEGLA
jgi:hypothetical protein